MPLEIPPTHQHPWGAQVLLVLQPPLGQQGQCTTQEEHPARLQATCLNHDLRCSSRETHEA